MVVAAFFDPAKAYHMHLSFGLSALSDFPTPKHFDIPQTK
jgi:hypothetical protein